MMVAVDMAPPAHIVISAVLASRRSSSCSAVVISRAPVAPTGWPRAIAPPLTLIERVPSGLPMCSHPIRTRSSFGKIVSRGFTPRPIMDMRGNLQQRAERILATALAEGTGDFVADVAVLMLAVAGNETTRNAISHGMQAFFDHPDQWELFKSERPETTADEIIRWGTVRQLRRGRLRPPGAFRHPPRPQPALRPRRLRRALLPGRPPGQARDRADLQRDRRRDARHPPGGRPGAAQVRLAQRHQAPPGHLYIAR